MVTKRDIYAVIAGFGLGKILPEGSTVQAAKLTIHGIARPLGRLALAGAKANPPLALATGLYAAHELGFLDPVYERAAPVKKKAMSKFNQAVKKGMAIVKASPSYGKKGVISNAKKAFTAVTKTVSKARRDQKKPKSGVLRSVYTAAAALLKRGMRGQKVGVGRGTTGIRKKAAKRRTTRAMPKWGTGPRSGR